MNEDLAARLRDGSAVVAGVLSGTSADGIDVALARFELSPGHPSPEPPSPEPPSPEPPSTEPPSTEPPSAGVVAGLGTGPRLALAEQIAFSVEPFPPPLAARVRAVLDGAPCGLRDAALLNRDLGLAFGATARAAAERAGVRLDLVGSHGQTVWHHDGEEPSGPATLQLGDGDFVAEAAGCAVVSDFRARDVAAGGEGAPLSAYADDLLFASVPRPFCVLNLGGMANVSYVAEDRLLAFDTGPCNSLLDGLARRFLDRPFDEGGRTALDASALLVGPGSEDESPCDPLGLRLLESRSPRGDRIRRWCGEMSRNPFFTREPPRSTGRDTFGEAWVERGIEAGRRLGLEPIPDLFIGAVRFIAAWVDNGARAFLPRADVPWLAAGGGVHNRALQAALRVFLPDLRPSSAYGVDPDAREALVFAALAARAVLGEAVTRAETTGARTGRVLGKLSPAPPR